MPPLARIDKVVALEDVDLFSSCRAQELVCISGMAEERVVWPGDAIYRTGDPADVLYVVVCGRVALTDADGDLRHVGAGQTIGVRDVLTGRRRNEDAEAEEKTQLLAIEAEDFIDLLSHNTDLIRTMFGYAFDPPRRQP